MGAGRTNDGLAHTYVCSRVAWLTLPAAPLLELAEAANVAMAFSFKREAEASVMGDSP